MAGLKASYRATLAPFSLVIYSVLFSLSWTLSVHGQVPYDQVKHRPILDQCRLQYPTSSPTRITQGNFPGNSVPGHFYLQGSSMMFSVTGASNRCEIRVEDEFRTNDTQTNRIEARVRLFFPDTSQMEQFTFMQVHSSAPVSGPLLRLYWHRDRDNKPDSLWAAIRLSPVTNESRTIYLGDRSNGFMPVEIGFLENVMAVKIDGDVKISRNIGAWSSRDMYFKAGVYNQTDGTSKAAFSWLRTYD